MEETFIFLYQCNDNEKKNPTIYIENRECMIFKNIETTECIGDIKNHIVGEYGLARKHCVVFKRIHYTSFTKNQFLF